MAIFKAGQLVTVNDSFLDEGIRIDLYNEPGGIGSNIRRIGYLKKKDVALIVASLRTDGSALYVIGPNGGGWTFGALLKILVEPKVDNASSPR